MPTEIAKRSPMAQGALLKDVKYDPALVQEGTLLYVSNCVFCHGVPGVDRGGNVPNLGYSATATIAVSISSCSVARMCRAACPTSQAS